MSELWPVVEAEVKRSHPEAEVLRYVLIVEYVEDGELKTWHGEGMLLDGPFG